MPPENSLVRSLLAGWRGVLLIAATYVYFLIFAQFGYLKRLDQLGIAGDHLKLVMGAMAAGGILMSLLAPRTLSRVGPGTRLRLALLGCAAAALFAGLPLTTAWAVMVSCFIGLSLGLLTVTLVTNLDLLLGDTEPLVQVGLGTGLGYLFCNVPALFRASPGGIALCSAMVCLAAIALVHLNPSRVLQLSPAKTPSPVSFPLLLAWFTALIWLDSAAFFIIQNSPALKSGTWEGAAHLWRNGTLHLVGALASAVLITRRGLPVTLLAAFACLGGACLLLLHPERAALAAILYPVGVSLYSVALVAAPSFLLGPSSRAARGQKSGLIYAVAGWAGSALGIGMGQNLHRVPPAFVAAAGVLFLLPWLAGLRRQHSAQGFVVFGSLFLAAGLQPLLSRRASTIASQTQIAHGREVYIAEGCIHCHSQYVRPHSASDTLMWGPARDVESIRREHPPLIGNRRQGPDLSEVGSRRSPLWLRIHFVNPRDVSPSSIMPAYEYLFRDTRGDDLIAYAANLQSPGSAANLRQMSTEWRPTVMASDPRADGPHLFGQYCATCHLAGGKARIRWAGAFRRLPPDLTAPDLPSVPGPFATAGERILRLAQIVKYGVPGSDMPGHEYLPDVDVTAIARYVNGLRPVPHSAAAATAVFRGHDLRH